MQRVFVVGCPRSGTTLVQAMLSRHPDIYSLEETYFFEALLGGAAARWGDLDARYSRHWYHRAGVAHSWGRRRLRQLERKYSPDRRRMIEPIGWRACVKHYLRLLDHAAQSQNKSCWVEKTPNHLIFLDEITGCVPDARFIHVLRNGMDVVASVMDADMEHNVSAFRGGVALWAARWNHAMNLHLDKVADPMHHLICLENLVADPAGEWARMCTFLDLKPDTPLLTHPGERVVNSRIEPWKRGASAGVVGRPVRKTQAIFGSRTMEWLEARLVDYQAVRALVECDVGDSDRPAIPAPGRAIRG